MNLFEIMERFPTHASCIEYLEGIRWRNGAHCPHCGSVDVYRKRDGKRIGRWHCKDCSASYNVLQGTVLQGTKIPLQKWFVAVTIIVNAKKSVSSCQLGRDLGLNQKSAWYMMQRIRAEMASKNDVLLRGIIEADETYLGGRPRRPNRREDDEPAPRGRGTSRTPVLGAAERDGNVVAEVAEDLTGRGILNFVRRAIQPKDSVLITDEYRAYRAVRSIMPHEVINHSVQYVLAVKRIRTRLRASGRCSRGHGTVRITTIQEGSRPCTWQRRVTNTITDVSRTCLASSSRVALLSVVSCIVTNMPIYFLFNSIQP